jgi:hypothetical protein
MDLLDLVSPLKNCQAEKNAEFGHLTRAYASRLTPTESLDLLAPATSAAL